MKGRQSMGDYMGILPFPAGVAKQPAKLEQKKVSAPDFHVTSHQQEPPKPGGGGDAAKKGGAPAWSTYMPVQAPAIGRPLPTPGLGMPPAGLYQMAPGAVPPPPPAAGVRLLSLSESFADDQPRPLPQIG